MRRSRPCQDLGGRVEDKGGAGGGSEFSGREIQKSKASDAKITFAIYRNYKKEGPRSRAEWVRGRIIGSGAGVGEQATDLLGPSPGSYSVLFSL